MENIKIQGPLYFCKIFWEATFISRFISHAHDILGLCARGKETNEVTEEAEGDRGFR